MNRYTLFCTEEQTKKAFKLGAPIKTRNYRFDDHSKDFFAENGKGYFIPTAEQMVGWLDDKVNDIQTIKNIDGTFAYIFYPTSGHKYQSGGQFTSRKDAIIAAIDAALEYLSNK